VAPDKGAVFPTRENLPSPNTSKNISPDFTGKEATNGRNKNPKTPPEPTPPTLLGMQRCGIFYKCQTFKLK